MKRLGMVVLAGLLVAGCGDGSKTASTATTTSSAATALEMSKVTRLTDCLRSDEALKAWGEHLAHVPSLPQIEAGSALTLLNNDYKATLTAEHALHTLEKDVSQTGEAVRSYDRTLEGAKQAIRGLMASAGNVSRAESALSELTGVADEYKSDQQALNQVCAGE